MQQDFEITILGTGSASPTKHRHPSSQFVRIGGEYILLDCGEGTVKQLATFGLRWHRLRIICITHLHGDHFYGLPGLLTTLSLHGRTEPMTIIGPPQIEEYINLVLSLGDGDLNFSINYIKADFDNCKTEIENDHCIIKTIPLSHRVPTVGYLLCENKFPRKINTEACQHYRVPVTFYEQLKMGLDYTDGDNNLIANSLLTFEATPARRYAYITDTIQKTDICEHIAGADLLYHESTFLQELKKRAEETFHSTAKQAGEIASMAGVKQLLLGHFSARYSDLTPMLEEAKAEFNNVIVAEEGITYNL